MNVHEYNEFLSWWKAMRRKCGSAFEREVIFSSKDHLWAQWVNANMKYGYHGPSDAQTLKDFEASA